ncbi:hypothetical protein [Subtercola frigoramans]|uniref:DUF3592 domain-containing protein n=1 Tax=Subtercola frigoramans TaxID=120298 RepID=A0ABS2L4C5_9MICO|nr:hypothetical protein [Subtercola frigoramans]MBM7471903.1 hypothetical protein [Subtercola frigoramans]
MARRLIPGPTAEQLGEATRKVALDAWIFAGVMFLGFGLNLQDHRPVGFLILCVYLGGFIAFSMAFSTLRIIFSYRVASEVGFGYTTLPQQNQQVEQLASETGRTIRAAGEPFLDKETLHYRIASGYDLSDDAGGPFRFPKQKSRWSTWQNASFAVSGLGVIATLLVRFVFT